MAMKNTKLLVLSKGHSPTILIAPKPIITSPNEILIRMKAIALNPADCKMIDQGHRVTTWPLVPGLDGAGIVEEVGEEVKNFGIGDEVLALFTPGDRAASFQNFAVIQEGMCARVPGGWSFEDAASLGVSYLTATMALGIGLRISLPFLIDGPRTSFNPASVLILGGSSALGAATMQLLRLALPECTILATSSPKNHNHITTTLGANAVFDRNSTSLIDDVRSASHGARGVDAIVDAVGAGGVRGDLFDVFDPLGPKRYAQVWTGDDEISVPDGVDSVLFRGRDLEKLDGGGNLMLSLQGLLKEGRYKLPLPVRRVGEGWEALQEGLELMRRGVSGEKLVITL